MSAGLLVAVLFGLNQHYGWNEGLIDESMDLMRQAGVNAYRDGVNRRMWEPDETSGAVEVETVYPSVRQHGGDKLPYRAFSLAALGASDGFSVVYGLNGTGWRNAGRFPADEASREEFAAYCREVVAATRGKVAWYQVWNEWDGAHEMQGADAGKVNTPENYVALLKVAAAAIRAEDPQAKVLANSFAMGDEPLFAAFRAGMLDHCDAYSIHPYDLAVTPEAVAARLRNVAQESARHNGGKPKPFLITEMGWRNDRHGVTDTVGADYLARMFLLARTVPGFEGMTWYCFNERLYDNRDGGSLWGVVMPDMTPKEGYYAMASVAPLARDAAFVRELPIPGGRRARALLFRHGDGRLAIAAWSLVKDVRVQLVLSRRGGWDKPLSFVRCGSPSVRRRWGWRDQAFGRPWNVAENPELFSFHVTERPVILDGVPEDFELVSAEEHDHSVANRHRPVLLPRRGGAISRTPRTVRLDRRDERVEIFGAWNGTNDFAVAMTRHYDDWGVHVALDVTDDVLCGSDDEKNFWRRDNATFGLCVVRDDKPIMKSRLYHLHPREAGGCCVHALDSKRQPAASGCRVDFSAADRTHYRYEFHVPFADLAAEEGTPVDAALFASGKAALGFSANARDCDGAELKTGIQWGEGTTEGKLASPTRYGWMFFE